MAKRSDDLRIWIDWSKPALASTVDWLSREYRTGRVWDLSPLWLVTPGVRVRHRLIALMVDHAESEKLDFRPPQFVPLSQLPEQLYTPRRPFADPLAQQIAWVEALRSMDGRRLSGLIRRVPAPESWSEWLPLARMLQSLHVDLAGDALDFSQMQSELSRLRAPASELERWDVLSQLQDAYYQVLSEDGLWDRQAARLTAIKNRECRADHTIVLVGLVDLSQSFRKMLEQVSAHVRPVVFSDSSDRSGFDAFGCLISNYWLERPLPLEDAQIRIADRPADQASEVLDVLAGLGGRYPASAIAVGIPDRSVVPHLRRALALAGVGCSDSAGHPVAETLPYRLLQLVIEYLRDPQFASFSQLVRHPDLFDWVVQEIGDSTWLASLTKYQNDFLPLDFPLRGALQKTAIEKYYPGLNAAYRLVGDLLGPLAAGLRPPQQWADPWRALLATVYTERSIDVDSEPDNRAWGAAQAVGAGLDALASVQAPRSLECSAVDAIELVLDQIRDESIAEPTAADDVELLGWLELPLEPSEVLIVTGFNEGIVPSSESSHLFVPNSLRSRLGILDNDRRYARDAYALSLMAHSPRRLTLISGRRGDDGDPLVPSRLMFAADEESAVGRAGRFFQHRPAASTRLWLESKKPPPAKQQFEIPQSFRSDPPVASLSVTDFKQYLQCPYRFYLNRVLRLEESVDDLAELPPFGFGQLIHDVMEAFAQHAIKDSTDPDAIREFFGRQLQRKLTRLGKHVAPCVRIQFAQVQRRLDVLADLQAQRRSDGWQIVDAEWKTDGAVLVVDGSPFGLRGRIDRLDRHESTGALAVYDYKSTSDPTPPDKAHRKSGAWIDLQLPLYRHLVRARSDYRDEPIELGYVLLPKDTRHTQFAAAPWTAEELESADAAAEDVIRRVRAGEFWPPVDPPPDYQEPLAAICQDDVSERWEQSEAAR